LFTFALPAAIQRSSGSSTLPGEGEKLGMLRREEHRDSSGVFINRKTYAYDALSRPMLELMN